LYTVYSFHFQCDPIIKHKLFLSTVSYVYIESITDCVITWLNQDCLTKKLLVCFSFLFIFFRREDGSWDKLWLTWKVSKQCKHMNYADKFRFHVWLYSLLRISAYTWNECLMLPCRVSRLFDCRNRTNEIVTSNKRTNKQTSDFKYD
jgi:hypothetical protein